MRAKTHAHPGPTPLQTYTGGTLGIPEYRALMSSGATSQNELVAIGDDPSAGGSSSSTAPTPAPTPEAVDVEAGNSCTGHVHELPADTIKAVDDFPVPAGFWRQWTREASNVYSIGVYVEPIDESTKPNEQVTIKIRNANNFRFFQV